MKKYNVQLIADNKGFLNSFKGVLEASHCFLSGKENSEMFVTEFTEEEIKKINPDYMKFAIEAK